MTPLRPSGSPPRGRVVADGKHLSLDGAPFHVRGVTYGGFRPREDGAEFPEPEQIRRDFQAMAHAGLNVVRTYTLPPADLFEAADENGIRLIVGLHYEDWRVVGPGRRSGRRVLRAGRAAVAEALERCGDARSVLAIAVGNEVPSDLVRLHGIHAVEETLSTLIDDVHAGGTDILATYCNYPTTEYLDVRGQDLVCFNVFLESEDKLRDYLRHLQIVSGDVPLVITELGLASERSGELAQAATLSSQLWLVDEAGCAGATVFAWTDEWFVGGYPVEGWGFGITDAERLPKPALDVVSEWARSSVRDLREKWPRVSVVVCAYNEERRILECLRSLERCDYPDLEVIFCDDGSTDRTLPIARRFPFTILDLPHGGLSVARNAGLAAATGEIIAYLDADAACHPEWPYHLALAFEDPKVAAAGGPNLPVPGAGFVERAVAQSPGGPIHVLISDTQAEHVPGCNMAFRRDVLNALGGFDPIFTAAGDDVDVCWRVLDAGHQIAYAPAAQVSHHRRDTVRGYLRQQRSYGKAERVVSGRHRHRCKRLGQARWAGSIYGGARVLPGILRPVIYHGWHGLAPFQTVVRHRSQHLLGWTSALLPLAAPLLLLAGLAPLSLWWLAVPGVVLATALGYAASVAHVAQPARGEDHRLAFRALVGFLHIVQPLARTWGRLRGRPAKPLAATHAPPVDRGTWLNAMRRELSRRRCTVRAGDEHRRWDLEVRAGPLLTARVTTALGWGKTPKWRASLRPRWTVAAGVAAAAVLAAVRSPVATWLPVALAVGIMLEASVIRSRLTASFEVTSGEAGSVAAAPVDLRDRQSKAARSARPKPHRVKERKPPRPAAARGSGDRHLARRIFAEGRSYRGRLVGLFLLGLLETPVLLLSPIPLKIAVDSVLGTHPIPGFLRAVLPSGATTTALRLLVVAAVLQVMVVLLVNLQQVATQLVGAQIGEGLTLRFRSKLFAHLQRLSLSFHDTRGTADSMYRIQYDASAVQDYLVKGVLPLLAAGVALVSMIVVTARIDFQLALVALSVSPVLFLLARTYKRSLRVKHRHAKQLESSALRVAQEVLTGLRVVKAFRAEEAEHDRFHTRAAEGMRARVRLVLAQSTLGTLVSVVTAIGTAIVLYIGVRNVRAGLLTTGELLVVIAYLSQLYSPLKTISKNVIQVQSALAGAERCFELVDRYPDVVDRPDVRRIRRAQGAIEFRGVSFAYEGGESVLSDVSVDVPAGTRLGIVGATGAGKTTLASLLMRFYEPTDGTILLDGIPLADYAVADLRRQFALVLQEPLLFSASVRENIAYGKPGARDDEIEEAARLARAHEFIVRLPHGYDTLVGERGMLLSGGERQRISLARAFLLDAPVLILDEPTSSVDGRTESLIVEAMDRLMENRTTLLISHRESTLRHCTAYIRIEEGAAVALPALDERSPRS